MAFHNTRTKRTKVAPSSYPKLPFHGLRCVQLVSSVIVGSIMFFFISHLSRERYGIPWTFIFFAAASCLTVLALATTIILHCCIGLNPRINLFVNSNLCVLWSAGFGMLSWWASETMFHSCTNDNVIGNDETGRMVCRIYKALYTFAALGFASTFLALALDMYVFRTATRLGKYVNMQHFGAKRGEDNSNGQDMAGYNAHESKSGMTSGYSVPQEQFAYDTSYHGPAHPEGDGYRMNFPTLK